MRVRAGRVPRRGANEVEEEEEEEWMGGVGECSSSGGGFFSALNARRSIGLLMEGALHLY